MPGLDDTLILVPRGGTGRIGVDALAAWHRPRGGITLVMNGSEWTGAAALDRALLAGRPTPDDWTLPDLHALGPVRHLGFGVPSPRTVLLDRDGTVIMDREYLADPNDVALLPGAAEGLKRLAQNGIRLVVISNQSGVGAGRITMAQLTAVNERLRFVLGQVGVAVDGIHCCVHRPDAGCACRKPLPGLAHAAAAELGLDLTRAVMVGDKAADLGLARALGIPGFLVTTGTGLRTLREAPEAADYLVDGLDEVARICTHPAGLAVAATPVYS